MLPLLPLPIPPFSIASDLFSVLGRGWLLPPPVPVPNYRKVTCCPLLRASVSLPDAQAPHKHPQPHITPPRI